MNKLFKYTLPMVALCGTLASCSDDTTNGGIVDPNHGKELIALSGNDNGVTRAALTRVAFSGDTKVLLRIKAEAENQTTRYAEATATAKQDVNNTDLSVLTYNSGSERYWDDAFGRDSKLTIYAFAIPGQTEAKLPTWAKTDWNQVDANTNPNWYTSTTEYKTVSWDVKTAQSASTMLEDDLTYSNNISATGNGGRYTYKYENNAWKESKDNGPLTWTAKASGETSGKFDKGHLEFHHALAWIEINLKEGNGFNNESEKDFVWTDNKAAASQNIRLIGFNSVGTFDVATGKWDDKSFTSSVDITKMKETTDESAKQTIRKLEAYVLPETNLYEKEANVVEFEIDNSKYYVTGKQIAEAIRKYYAEGAGKVENVTSPYETFETIEAGKHYVINLTVAKKGIDKIKAAVIEWGTVNSDDADAKNTHSEFTLDDRGDKLGSGDEAKFNFYRSAKIAQNYIDGVDDKNYDWMTGYAGPVTKKCTDATNKIWKSEWYWENNLTYYHFRAAGYTENASGIPTITIETDKTKTPNEDYFVIKSGALKNSDYKDYIWGAPFNDHSGALTYSTKTGFDNTSGDTHQISQAIGATESEIRMLLFHMTSQIYVNVKTTTGVDKVTLYDAAKTNPNTKVEILNFLPDGKVLMGNGLVTAYGDRTSKAEMTIGTYNAGNDNTGASVPFSYGIVPQLLSDGTTEGTIGLRITTPDGNQYIVKDLSTCTATAINNNSLTNPYTEKDDKGNYKITSWYPGYQYTYTITIKKTGIERITAAVVGWETVNGDLGTIDLEN